MPSAALSGFGTLFKIGDGGGSEVFTTVAEVADIGGPNMEMSPIEVTNHSSTSGWREFIAGLKDGGEVSLTLNFIPTAATQSQTSGVLKDFKNGTKRNWQIVFPDVGNTTWTFAGFVTAFGPKEPIDDKLSADVTIKVTGVPTLAG